jgi:hypothetical protein
VILPGVLALFLAPRHCSRASPLRWERSVSLSLTPGYTGATTAEFLGAVDCKRGHGTHYGTPAAFFPDGFIANDGHIRGWTITADWALLTAKVSRRAIRYSEECWRLPSPVTPRGTCTKMVGATPIGLLSPPQCRSFRSGGDLVGSEATSSAGRAPLALLSALVRVDVVCVCAPIYLTPTHWIEVRRPEPFVRRTIDQCMGSK